MMERLNEYMEAQKFLETLDWDDIPNSSEHLATICEALQEIQKYKYLEEQGLLLRVRCKVGDTVYYKTNNGGIYPVKIIDIDISSSDLSDISYSGYFMKCTYEFDNSDFGKTVFLTREEAEQKLKEMESD